MGFLERLRKIEKESKNWEEEERRIDQRREREKTEREREGKILFKSITQYKWELAGLGLI